ncbi:MAG: hypothetical protein R3C56_16000 [Pirellulaceae bacterium]
MSQTQKAFGGPMVAVGEMQKRKDQGAQLLVNSSEFHGWYTGLSQDSLKFDELN